jgi:hypothetical protein
VGIPRGESRVASWEHTRYGYTQFHSGGRSRSDASRALPASRSQDRVVESSRALARRKLEAPPDAGHEPREGETVRGIALTIKSTCWFGLWASQRWELAGSRYDGRCSRAFARIALTGSAKRGPSARRFSLVTIDPAKAGAWDRQRIGRHRGRSGVPASDHESIRWSTRFGEGSTRSEKAQGEFASSTLKRRWRAVRRNEIALS